MSLRSVSHVFRISIFDVPYISSSQYNWIYKSFFTCLISFFIFAEKLNLKLIVLIFLGFLGIILITRPGQIESGTGVYMALLSAISVSGGIISISYLSKREETLTILFYHSLFSTIIFFFNFL